VLLIDDRVPPAPREERAVWEPDWRLCGWVAAAVGATAGSVLTGGFVSFLLVCAAIACGAHAATSALPYGYGLREHRQ
jgi:hypothetical protein